MQTAIAGELGCLYVIHLLDHPKGLVSGEQAAQIIDVIQIVADNADACHILDIGVDIVYSNGMSPALKLLHNRVQGLDAVLDVMDGRAIIERGKLLVQDLHLCHSHL